jgi:hypothetical protein
MQKHFLCPLENFPFQVLQEKLFEMEWGEELVELQPYYIQSMLPRFFKADGLPKNNSTILRHLLRAHKYNLKGQETMREGKKTILYHFIPPNINYELPEEIVISFD